MSEPKPFDPEPAVRGYELARKVGTGPWNQVMKYREGERGLRRALGDARWLNMRQVERGMPDGQYAVRLLVSVSPPPPPPEPTIEAAEIPTPTEGAE